MRNLSEVIRSYIRGLGWRGWLHWLIIAILAFALIRGCFRERAYEQRIEQLSSVKPKPETGTTKQAEKIAERVNKEGQTITIYKEAEPITKMIEDKSKADSLLKVAEVERGKTTALTTINGTLSKENTELRRQIQTLESGKLDTSWAYRDRYLTLIGDRPSDTVFRIRNLTADASVNRVEHERRKFWLFGRNENLSTVWFNSPYIKVDGMETLKIKQRDPLVDFKFYLDGKYLHNPGEVLIGPKVKLNIGRVGLQGGYYLNPGGGLSGPWYGVEWKVY